MTKDEAIQKIISVLGEPYGTGDELSFSCCNKDCSSHQKNKKKLSLNTISGKWHCWVCEISGNSFSSLLRSCGEKGIRISKENLDEFSSVKENLEKIDVLETKEKIKSIAIPSQFKPIISNQDLDSDYFKQALIYLRKRKLSYFDIIKYRIHYNTEKYQILIPSYDNNGDILLYFIRNIFDSWKEYPSVERTKIIFNELFIDWQSPIILTEGIFDAFTAGSNAIPLLGSNIKSDHLLFKRIINKKSEIYIALDPDAKDKMMKISKLFHSHGIKVNVVELQNGDINELGKEEFKKCLENSYVYNDMRDIKSKLLSL